LIDWENSETVNSGMLKDKILLNYVDRWERPAPAGHTNFSSKHLLIFLQCPAGAGRSQYFAFSNS
jgi:hypothetical protein